jgi:hypothetical protein
VSAGITKGLTNVQRAADNVGEGLGSRVAGLTGGTVSAMTGGKFANGFQTSIFQYLFNAKSTDMANALRSRLMSKVDTESIRRNYVGKKQVDLNDNGTNECAEFVQDVTEIEPGTSGKWAQGSSVKELSDIEPGTAIATFNKDGKYKGHTAIYIGQNRKGIQVFDQWNGVYVQERALRFGNPKYVNNGDNYHVILH